MSKRKDEETSAPPSEMTLRLLEPARGVSDMGHPQVAQAASQLLGLPREEQVVAVRWMGTQPEYAALLGYLVGRAGVTGTLRRAVKQAMFELRRRGIHIQVPAESIAPARETSSLSQAWAVEEVFGAAPYFTERGAFAAHLRFFMRHASGQKTVFTMDIDLDGYLRYAHLFDEEVRELYQQCLDNPPRYRETTEEGSPYTNGFVQLPVEWATHVAHEFHQRTLQAMRRMPPHAAFYWGRLPEPPAEDVSYPWDSISDAETGWLVSSLLTPGVQREATRSALEVLLPYAPAPEELLEVADRVFKEMETQVLLLPQTEEQRSQQTIERIQQALFPDESLRETLLFMLPVFGSIHLLGGDRASAVWLKGVWRELKERPDRPFWRTATATVLTAVAYHVFSATAGIEPSKEERDAPS
jgi:hypothetical protein